MCFSLTRTESQKGRTEISQQPSLLISYILISVYFLQYVYSSTTSFDPHNEPNKRTWQVQLLSIFTNKRLNLQMQWLPQGHPCCRGLASLKSDLSFLLSLHTLQCARLLLRSSFIYEKHILLWLLWHPHRRFWGYLWSSDKPLPLHLYEKGDDNVPPFCLFPEHIVLSSPNCTRNTTASDKGGASSFLALKIENNCA